MSNRVLRQMLSPALYFDLKREAGDNIWRNTRLDKNYLLNILAGKEWMVGRNKQNVLSLNGRIFFQGGDRYTPVDEGKSMIEHDIKFDEGRRGGAGTAPPTPRKVAQRAAAPCRRKPAVIRRQE